MNLDKKDIINQLQASINAMEASPKKKSFNKISKARYCSNSELSYVSNNKTTNVEDENSFTKNLEEFNTEANAFKRIEYLIRVRDRSVYEVSSRLNKLGFSDDVISLAINRAINCNFLNDERFADVYIRSKLNQGKGIDGIARDLCRQNIDVNSISGFPDKFLEDYDLEEERAYNLLLKKPPRAKNKFQAGYAKLIRNGFSSSIATYAVKKWIANSEFN